MKIAAGLYCQLSYHYSVFIHPYPKETVFKIPVHVISFAQTLFPYTAYPIKPIPFLSVFPITIQSNILLGFVSSIPVYSSRSL